MLLLPALESQAHVLRKIIQSDVLGIWDGSMISDENWILNAHFKFLKLAAQLFKAF